MAKFITHHLVSGYIPVAVALVLYFILLYVMGKKQTFGHIIGSFVFCFYLVGILTMTGVCIGGSFSPRIVYIPFLDMIRGPVDTVLNIFLFVPLGFMLPILYRKYDRISKIALVAFFVSLSVELAQMFGTGATDISSREYFRKNVLAPLVKSGRLKRTIPDKPNSSKQKYFKA